MAEEEKKVSEKNKNKDMNKNKEEKKKNNTKKVQKNVEKNKTNKKEKVQGKEPKKVKDEVKVNIEKEEKAVIDNNAKKDEFEVKQTITAKKQNTGLKILGILVLLVIVCLAGLYIKYVVIDKNTIGEVTRALMNTLSPKEKLYEALENTYKEKNIEQTFNAKITEFDSKVLGKNLVNVFGQKELEETIKGLELKGTAKRENSKTSMSAKLNYNEKSLIDAEIYQEIGKEGIAKFFGDEDLAVKLPKGVEVDTSKVEEYMNILRDLKKTYDSKYSDIIKYIDENIIKIEEKDGKIIVRTSFEQIKSSLKGLLLKIKEKQEENKKHLGKCYYMEDKEYIYVDDGGKRLRPNYLTTRFGKFLKKFNLKHIRFHDLRHSCATILYDNNAGIKEIQTYLGHSSVKTTMEIYVHLMNRNDKSVVDVLGKKLKI